MKKLILVVLAVMLSGCMNPGYEIICSSKGELFKQFQSGMASPAESLQNKRQVCFNQPDGTIIIKSTGLQND